MKVKHYVLIVILIAEMIGGAFATMVIIPSTTEAIALGGVTVTGQLYFNSDNSSNPPNGSTVPDRLIISGQAELYVIQNGKVVKGRTISISGTTYTKTYYNESINKTYYYQGFFKASGTAPYNLCYFTGTIYSISNISGENYELGILPSCTSLKCPVDSNGNYHPTPVLSCDIGKIVIKK